MTDRPTARRAVAASVVASALTLSAAQAAVTTYTVDFDPLNGSGVEGSATLAHDDVANTLSVSASATGLDAGLHPMHIHGTFEQGADGTLSDAVTPAPSADQDGDGYVEVMEGLPAYGPILVPLVTDVSDDASFPVVGEDGTISYSQTFDLSNASIFAPVPDTDDTYEASDLFPLVFREMVIHGLVVPEGAGAGTMFEVDGECTADLDFPREDGCYVARLPVAAGTIEQAADVVPLPGAAALFLTAGAAGGAFRLRRES